MSTTWNRNGSAGLARDHDDRSVGEIVRDLTGHGRELLKGEVALAKRELVDNARFMAVPIGMAVGAAVLALTCVVLVGHAMAWALITAMPPWAAYLVTALVFCVAAAALAFGAKKAFEKAQIAPTETISEAKEDLTWIREHAR